MFESFATSVPATAEQFISLSESFGFSFCEICSIKHRALHQHFDCISMTIIPIFHLHHTDTLGKLLNIGLLFHQLAILLIFDRCKHPLGDDIFGFQISS